MYAPTAGSIRFAGEEIAGLPANRVCHKGIGRTYQIPRPFRNLTLLENVALSAWFGQHGKTDRAACWRQAEEALGLVGLPTDAHTTTDGLGAAALKKLELARALATQPKLLLADESLNGLDHSEMEQAADMLQRIRTEKGITIVWVEHIMGVLMRVVDRVVVLDHGEKIFDGAPKAAQSDARVVEVYLGADARPDAGAREHRCGLRRLPGAVRRLHERQRRRGRGRDRRQRRRQDHAAARHLRPAGADRRHA